jgi:hypothetical protein
MPSALGMHSAHYKSLHRVHLSLLLKVKMMQRDGWCNEFAVRYVHLCCWHCSTLAMPGVLLTLAWVSSVVTSMSFEATGLACLFDMLCHGVGM